MLITLYLIIGAIIAYFGTYLDFRQREQLGLELQRVTGKVVNLEPSTISVFLGFVLITAIWPLIIIYSFFKTS